MPLPYNGGYRFNGSLFLAQVLRREGHAPPLQRVIDAPTL